MYALIRPFVEVALFRRGPQHLPSSRLLLAITLLAHCVLGFVLFAPRLGGFNGLLAAIVGTALLAALTASLMFANGLGDRTLRTLTALAGTDVVVNVVGLPVLLLVNATNGDSAAGGIVGLAALALLVWNLAITGNVLRHALSAPLVMGMVLALIFFVVSLTVIHNLFSVAD